MARAARPTLLTPQFIAIILASLGYFTAFGATLPVLPVYVEEGLGGGPVAVGLAMGSFSFTALFLRPVVGRLGDRRGRRLLMIAGSAVVLASMLALIPASSVPMVIAARLLLGVGEAMFFTGAASAVNDIAPDERRGEAVSLFSLALYGGLALGPILGETVMGEGRFDAAWLAASAAAVACLLLSLRIPDTRPPELRAHAASTPGRIIHPGVFLPGTLLLTSVLGFAGFNSFIALHARDLGLSRAGFVFLAYAVLMVTIRSAGRRIPDVLGVETTGRISLATSALGLVILGVWASIPGLFVGTVVFAVGQALAFPAFMAMAVRAASPAERGAAVGTFSAFFDLAFGLGAISLGAVNGALGTEGMFVAAGVVAAVGLVVLLVAGKRRPDLMAPAPSVLPAEPV